MIVDTLVLGLDSLVAAIAVAPLVPRVRTRALLAVAIGGADGAASLAATAGGVAVYVVAAAIVVAALAIAIWLPGASRLRPLCALPVVLSIDNLASPLPPNDALLAGVTSTALAALGFSLAALAYRALPARYHTHTAALVAGLAVLVIVL